LTRTVYTNHGASLTGGAVVVRLLWGEQLGCGACAGATGQTVAYPLDVLRRRLQMSGWEGGEAIQGGAYKGMGDCFVRTLRHEGVSGLFKGLGANYVKVVPSIAIAFVTYEQVKVALGVEIRIGE